MNYAINSKETTKTAGVYSIQNVCDGKIYVGSTVDFTPAESEAEKSQSAGK